MRIPKNAPSDNELFDEILRPDVFARLMSLVPGPNVQGRYLHWDRLKYYPKPDGLSLKQWWFGLRFRRLPQTRAVSLSDTLGRPFHFNLADPLPQRLHEVDLSAGGTIEIPELVTNDATKKDFLVRSLIEEAFTSSQLEGAGTTRDRAKELIRRGRPPRDRGERMVLNNYRTMEHILELRDEPLSQEVVFAIHRMVTEGTFDDPSAAGRFRKHDEYKVVGDFAGDVVYHQPPAASELEDRMRSMCDFANGDGSGGFIHPAIRAMILHFWLAYDHPFVDGNGRTARALFYWLMLRHGYWLFEYISISSIILDGPIKYERAFLETETDNNDLTYFLIYHAEVIDRSIRRAHDYVQRKMSHVRSATTDLRSMIDLNHRQRVALVEAMRHPDLGITIESHRRSFGVVTQTARTDLLDLVARGFLRKAKVGRSFEFWPVPDLEDRLKRPKSPPHA